MTDDAEAKEGAYEFGEFRIEPARRLLLHRDETAPLTAKAFDTLLVLVRRDGELVGKDDLIRAPSGPTRSSKRTTSTRHRRITSGSPGPAR